MKHLTVKAAEVKENLDCPQFLLLFVPQQSHGQAGLALIKLPQQQILGNCKVLLLSRTTTDKSHEQIECSLYPQNAVERSLFCASEISYSQAGVALQ